ncbi:glycosyltransferase family 4 protein [Candidatus Daviesbacteria bacterium]|nr:glycosyltransferase family 4 protein [Candidatus Daviesbacteria bacterium]
MKIGIDSRLINESGIGRYIRNLLFYLQKIDKENEYFIFLLEKDFDNSSFKKNFNKVKVDFGWYGLSEQLKFPKILARFNLDLVHFPHFNIPIFFNSKFIVTIHDLIHQDFQMRRATTRDPFTYQIKKLGYNQIFKTAVRNSSKILVPSEHVRQQLIDRWRVSVDKIVITPEGVDDQIIKFSENLSTSKVSEILDRLHIKKPYIFYVGNAHPHKNIQRLIESFLLIKEKRPDLNLVLSGNSHYFWEQIIKENKNNSIQFTGKVTDEELVALYKSASCFVMPSLEEGFGIPLLEAFLCKCPVVSSSAGSLKEVGGDGTLYFDPKDNVDMAEKILTVVDDKKVQNELINNGLGQVSKFSWEDLAKKTLEVYLK